jgi:uncharacterized protein YecT (DUF1311 family)
MIRTHALAVASLLLVAPLGVQARATLPLPSVYDRCMAAPAAQAKAGAIACVTTETQRQDAIVSRRYASLMKDVREQENRTDPPDASLSDSLHRGQQAWAAFRDADCAVYASKTWGARGDLDARKCVLEHTSDRAGEIGFVTGADSDTPPPPPSAFKKPKGPMSAYDRCMSRPKEAQLMEAMACTGQETESQDTRLNRAYKAIMVQLAPGDRDAMRAAQRAWIAYRDGDRDMLLDQSMWGMEASFRYGETLLDRTATRVSQLEAFIKSHGLQAPR